MSRNPNCRTVGGPGWWSNYRLADPRSSPDSRVVRHESFAPTLTPAGRSLDSVITCPGLRQHYA